MNRGWILGNPSVFSKSQTQETWLATPPEPTTPTYVIHHLGYLLQLIRANVGTEGEAKVKQDPLAKKILTGWLVPIVVNEGERPSQSCLAIGLCLPLLGHYRMFGNGSESRIFGSYTLLSLSLSCVRRAQWVLQLPPQMQTMSKISAAGQRHYAIFAHKHIID